MPPQRPSRPHSQKSIIMANIFIVGSKPQAVWPDVAPDQIYTANGALARVQSWANEGVPVTAFLYRYFFKNHPKYNHTPTVEAVNGCVAERIIVSGGAGRTKDFVTAEDRGLRYNERHDLSRRAAFLLKLRFAGLRLFPEEFGRLAQSPSAYCQALRKTRMLDSFSCSTGMLALLYAASCARAGDQLYLIGVGAARDTGHFYNAGVPFARHVRQDQFLSAGPSAALVNA